MKRNLVIINNTFSNKNPVLLNLDHLIADYINVNIIGKERISKNHAFKHLKYHNNFIINFFLVQLQILFHLLFSKLFPNLKHYLYVLFNIKIYNRYLFIKLLFMNFDAVLFLETESAELSYLIKKYLKKPCLYFIYEFYCEQVLDNNQYKYNLYYNVEKKALTSVDTLVGGPNDVLADYLIKKFHLKNKRKIPFVIVPTNDNLVSQEYNKTEKLKFYYCGALIQNRGLEELVLTMQYIDDATLYIRGKGKLLNHLIRLVNENNLESKVQFLDFIDTTMLVKEAAKFDVGLTMVRMNVDNHKYATGFKTFENIAAGLALVLPASYPLIPLVKNYNIGITYQDATIEYLKQTLQYCVNNRPLINEWKSNTRRLFSNTFNPLNQIKQLKAEIEFLIENYE